MSLTATQNEPTQASWIVTHLHCGSPLHALYIPIASKRLAHATNMCAMSLFYTRSDMKYNTIPARMEEEFPTNFLDFDIV